jgi:hypothetical protein
MDILELKGKSFLPKIRSLSRQRERFKFRSKNKQSINESNSRYYSLTTETQEWLKRTPSPQRQLPYRIIDSIIQNPYRTKVKLTPNFSHSPEKDSTGVLTSFHIKSKLSAKLPLKLTGNLHKISKTFGQINNSNLTCGKFLEIGCQIDLN